MTEKELPAVSVPECWVVKVKSFMAPGVAVIADDVPDLVSAVACMVVDSAVSTILNPLMPLDTPKVKVWLPLAGLEATVPLG